MWGRCMCAQVRSNGFLEPLNAAALPLGGLRQDHHGYESMPVSPAASVPFHATLEPLVANATSGGLINLLVAPDNSSIVRTGCLPPITLSGCACRVSLHGFACPTGRSSLVDHPTK